MMHVWPWFSSGAMSDGHGREIDSRIVACDRAI